MVQRENQQCRNKVIQGKSDMAQVMEEQARAESCRVLWGLVRNLVESH